MLFLKIFEMSTPGSLCNISYDNYMKIAGRLIFFKRCKVFIMLVDRDTTVNILEFSNVVVLIASLRCANCFFCH